MSSAKHRYVPECPNMKSHKEGSYTALHMFPNPDKDGNRFNTWLYAMSGDILDQENVYDAEEFKTIMYEFNILNPNFEDLGYLKVVANINDKHDRSTPSSYHWKVLKCRMIIFSASNILACPDKTDEKQVHVIFNKVGRDYDFLLSYFLRFSLQQVGGINKVTPDTYLMCFQYTMTAKIAPVWNALGYNYLINNRDFLTTAGPQNGIQYFLNNNDKFMKLEVKPVKIHFIKSDEPFAAEEFVRVLPSLNKAIVEERYENMPTSGDFKSYKDLRRHWKNIHGYRLPDAEGAYYSIRFWRGEPLTYPEICLNRTFPIITPLPKSAWVASAFLECLQNKMANFVGQPSLLQPQTLKCMSEHDDNECLKSTQAVSLCTPSQNQDK